MSEAICEHCGECTPVFGHGESAKALSNNYKIPFLGSIPLLPSSLQVTSDSSFLKNFISDPKFTESFNQIVSLFNEPFTN